MRSPYEGEIHRGYIQSWNFTVEHKLPADIVVTAGYVGTQSTHMLADLNINAGYPGSGTANLPYAQLFGRTTATNMWDGYLSANYHSLQTSINKRFSKGLLLKGAYTWSKAMNMTDDDGWAGVNWNWGPRFAATMPRPGTIALTSSRWGGSMNCRSARVSHGQTPVRRPTS